jgi:hypothetical protein
MASGAEFSGLIFDSLGALIKVSGSFISASGIPTGWYGGSQNDSSRNEIQYVVYNKYVKRVLIANGSPF